jgi:hypothetical protein
MLVDARMSLFVIYPGLKVFLERDFSRGAMDANADIGDSDPFAGDVNFGVFVNETGGKLFYNRNDVDAEIKRSQLLGSQYYTLTYQPHDGKDDGKFRRIRVTLRDRNLQVITKAGYFAPARGAKVDPQQQRMIDISQAARSTVPFTALNVEVAGVVRHPDARTAEITVVIKGKNLNWQVNDDGRSTAKLTLAAVSLTERRDILASRIETITLRTTQDGNLSGEESARLALTIPVPRKTRSVRVVAETATGGRIGGADVDRKTIEASPEAPTPRAPLLHRQSNETAPPPGKP